MADQISLLIDQLAQLKRELRARDERFRSLITQNVDGILIVDRAGVVYFANPAAERLLGRSANDLIGRPFGYPIIANENAEIDVLCAGEAPRIAELRAVRTEWEGAAAFVVSLRDVSERKRIELALRDSQLRLALALDATNDGIWDWNLKTGFIYYSPRWLETLGYSAADMHPTPAFRDNLIHPADRPAMQTQLQQHLDGRTSVYRSEFRLRARSGEWRWTMDRGKVVEWDNAGQPLRMVGSSTDITDHRKALDGIRANEAKYRNLTESMPEIVFETDLRGRITYANRRALEVFAYAPADLQRGLDLTDMLIPDDRRRAQVNFQRLLAGERSDGNEYTALRSDGRRFPILVYSMVVFYDQEPIGVAGFIVDMTERRQAEEALRQGEERYRTLLENLPVGVYRTTPGPQGRFLVANAALLKILGFDSFEQLQLYNVSDVYADPADRMAFSARLLAHGSVFNDEVRLKRLNGTLLWAAITARVVTAADGQTRYFDCTMLDVTDRKRAERAETEQRALAEGLRDTAAALTSTLNGEEVLDRILDNVGRIVPNDLATILLLDADEQVARSVRVLGQPGVTMPPLGYSLPLADAINVRRMAETAQPYAVGDVPSEPGWLWIKELEWIRSHVGAPIRHKNAVIGFLNLYSRVPNFYNTSHAEHLQAFADQAAVAIENARLYRQVQQYAAELETRVERRTVELDRERQRLRAILDAAGEGIAFTDLDGTLEYVNPAMERLTGYQTAESLGKTPRLWRSSQTPRATYDQLWATILNGGIWRGEMINQRKDGTLYDVAMIVAPLLDADGSIMGFVSIQRDITRQKELDRLKDQFVANVSHELRTPLSNVKLYLNRMDRGGPAQQTQFLPILQRETARLESLIENLLSISRLDLGQIQIDLAPVDLNQLIAQLVLDRATLIAARGLSVESQPAPDLPRAWASPTLVGQIMSNLMTNAMHYTPPGGTLRVSTALRERAGQTWATITVADTGPGISARDLPHLFERFYRGDAGRRSGMPGTGLGLAICAEIASRLNGQITVDSQAGHGAAFTVWLPRAPE